MLRTRREVKLRKLLPPRRSVSRHSRERRSLVRSRKVQMHTSNSLVNVSACLEDGKGNGLNESTVGKGGSVAISSSRPRVMCYEKVLLTFKFYNARMTRLLQIFVFAHSWNIQRTQSALVRYKTARRFLSRRELSWKFTVGLSHIYFPCVFPVPHLEENFILRDIFPILILSPDNSWYLWRLFCSNVQLRENMQTDRENGPTFLH